MDAGRVSAALSVAFHIALLVTLGRLSKSPSDASASVSGVRVAVRTVEPASPAVRPDAPEDDQRAAPARRSPVVKVRAKTRVRAAAPIRAPDSPTGGRSRRPGAGGLNGPPGPPDRLDLRVQPTLPAPSWVTPPAPPRPSTPPLGYAIKPQAGGGYIVQDRQVWAEIHRDGRITFHDRPWVRPEARAGRGRVGEAMHASGNGPYKVTETRDLSNPAPSASFSMDLNDVILRAVGDDPYGGIKRDILTETRALREQLADEACQEDLRESLVALNGKLQRIWAGVHLSPRSRREHLFALWDECLEDGDGIRARHGRMARDTILAFIRRHLPAGSSAAFLPEELRALNQRRLSRERFEPYGAL